MKPLTLKQVIRAFDAISLLIEKDAKDKYVFPSAVRIKFAMNLRLIKPYVEDFQKEHNDLVKKYGVVQKDGSWRVESEELLKKFNAERDAALDVETQAALSPVEVKELGDNQLPIDLIVVLIETGLVKE